jgi:hypothetical protein
MSYGFDSPYLPPAAEIDVVSRVQAPALALMINAGVGVCISVTSLGVFALAAIFAVAAGGEAVIFGLVWFTMGLVTSFCTLCGGLFVIYGALKMKRAESYKLAVAASIMAMVPGLSPCYFVGLPLGIWSLVVLLNQENKRGFLA